MTITKYDRFAIIPTRCDELIETYKSEWCSDFGEYDMPTIWLVNKEFKNRTLITEFYTDNVTLSYDGIATLNALFEQYTFLDGSVCGVEDE